MAQSFLALIDCSQLSHQFFFDLGTEHSLHLDFCWLVIYALLHSLGPDTLPRELMRELVPDALFELGLKHLLSQLNLEWLEKLLLPTTASSKGKTHFSIVYFHMQANVLVQPSCLQQCVLHMVVNLHNPRKATLNLVHLIFSLIGTGSSIFSLTHE